MDSPHNDSAATDLDARKRFLAAMPIAMRERSIGGVATAVWEGGTGPPLVLLHSSGEFAALWMRVIPDLMTTHRVVVPDLPGHGGSRIVDPRFGSDQVLDWLDEMV